MHFVRCYPTFSAIRTGLLSRSWFPLLYSINTKLVPTCKQPCELYGRGWVMYEHPGILTRSWCTIQKVWGVLYMYQTYMCYTCSSTHTMHCKLYTQALHLYLYTCNAYIGYIHMCYTCISAHAMYYKLFTHVLHLYLYIRNAL